jgi:hypothetical protein
LLHQNNEIGLAVFGSVAAATSSKTIFSPPCGHRLKHCIEYKIELFAEVVGQKAENKKSVTLKYGVLATVATIGLGIAKMLSAVDLNHELGCCAQQIDFHLTAIVKWDRIYARDQIAGGRPPLVLENASGTGRFSPLAVNGS